MKTNKLLFISFLLCAFSMNISAKYIQGETYFITDFSESASGSPNDRMGWYVGGGYSSEGLSLTNIDMNYLSEADGLYNLIIEGGYPYLLLTGCRKVEVKLSITGFPTAPDNFLKFRFTNENGDNSDVVPSLTAADRDGSDITRTLDFSGMTMVQWGDKGLLWYFRIKPNDDSATPDWGDGTITLKYLKIGDYVIPPTEIQTEDTSIYYDLGADVLHISTDDYSIPPYNWWWSVFSAEGLPEGVTIDSNNGVISGELGEELTATVTATVTLAYGVTGWYEPPYPNPFTATQEIKFLPPPLGTSAAEVLQTAPALFPNPASDVFTIKNALGKAVSIYTSLGSKVFETAQLSNETISVADWASGIYFVKVDKTVLKLIKK